MSKEKIEITFTPEEESPRMITIEAPDFNGSKKSLRNLKKEIRQLKENHPDTLIHVRTPQIDSSQMEALFGAGAKGFTLIPQEKEKINS